MDEKKKKLGYAVLEFLTSTKDALNDEEKKESMDVAIQCISDVFGVDLADQSQQVLYSIKPLTLLSIFNVYLTTAAKKQTSAAASAPATAAQPTPKAAAPSDADKKKAEEKKTAGNAKMGEKKYDESIELYSEAIELDPQNAVYFANRAAAYSQKGEHEQAVEDAAKAVEIDPNYSKAYSRLGLALYSLGQYSEAVEAYEKGVKLDPSNATMKGQLQAAKDRAKTASPSTADVAGAPSAAGPGGFDINSMLSNPAFTQMASQMMQNPEMLSNLMNNPMLQNLMGSVGGGGGAGAGGAPGGGGIADLLNNPALAQMAQSFLGGRGAGNGSS